MIATITKQGATLNDFFDLVEPLDLEQTKQTVEALEESIQHLKAAIKSKERSKVGFLRRKKLLGVEQKAQEILREEMKALKKELSDAVAKKERLVKYRDYPTLSLDPLRWRDRDRNPVFAILDPSSPKMTLTATSWANYSPDHKLHPKLPSILERSYKDVLVRLSAEGKKKLEGSYADSAKIAIKTTYAGMVPESTKQKMKDAKKVFPYIFFITEGTWEKSEKMISVDPLVVGFDPEDECFYLIDKFDLQPTERHWVEEFPGN